MPERLTIVVAPNEDGLGTSAWVTRLAKELWRRGAGRISKIKVVVATQRRYDFHSDKYGGGGIEVVRLSDGSNPIELVRRDGAVEVAASIESALLPYPESRSQYGSELAKHAMLEDADLVIDFGVPQLVRAVAEENRRRAGMGQTSIVSVTIFDHAWSLSLRKIVLGNSSENEVDGEVENALAQIEHDEKLTSQAILFPEPICPLEYHEYWRRLCGRPPAVLPGTLGGPLSTLEFAQAAGGAFGRRQTQCRGECSAEAFDQARQHARRLLAIDNDLPVLFISGAGTAVWDEVLTGLIDAYQWSEPTYNAVIFSRCEVERRGIALALTPGGVEVGRLPEKKRVLFIDRVAGETHHVLFPAFDLVLTRGGGGTVNDAIACGVPLVLIEEPRMWQVEQIRQACLEMQLAKGFTLETFKKRPRHCVESDDGALKRLDSERERIRAIPNHSEAWLAERLLGWGEISPKPS